MKEYQDLVTSVLTKGTYKFNNRTGMGTIAKANPPQYRVDLANGFPLLTTKEMHLDSLFAELAWYFSGEEHIRNLKKHTKIWDLWADEEGNLQTAYGRFWRRFPVPETGALVGEHFVKEGDVGVKREENGALVLDQLAYAAHLLKQDPSSRRAVVTAWNPANAAGSKLPPCHAMYAFNVEQGRLHTHLFQRSADMALGVPFNLAGYAVITQLMAQLTGNEPGEFVHSIVDGHIYCGKNERAQFYADEANLSELRQRTLRIREAGALDDTLAWIKANAAPEPVEDKGYDHVPNMLKQLARDPLPTTARLIIKANGLDDITKESFEVQNYQHQPRLFFKLVQ